MAVATARVNELAALIPEPVASVAEANRSLTPDQRATLWASRTAAMELLAQQRTELGERLDRLSARSGERSLEFREVQTAQDFERLAEIAEWFKAHEDEVDQLKILLSELDALYGEVEANPVDPT